MPGAGRRLRAPVRRRRWEVSRPSLDC
jgi:hypothetical protein